MELKQILPKRIKFTDEDGFDIMNPHRCPFGQTVHYCYPGSIEDRPSVLESMGLSEISTNVEEITNWLVEHGFWIDPADNSPSSWELLEDEWVIQLTELNS